MKCEQMEKKTPLRTVTNFQNTFLGLKKGFSNHQLKKQLFFNEMVTFQKDKI